MQTSIGLSLAFVSALAVNLAYVKEHDAVAAMPSFSLRRPLQFVSKLLENRKWLEGFGLESTGWLVYVAALRLAPISLVQAVSASGIAVLAFGTAHGHPGRLARTEQLAVVVAFAGLTLLSLSLVGTHQPDHRPGVAAIAVWLACLLAGGILLGLTSLGLARAPALGLSAGLLFAGGDICAKLAVYGGPWLLAVPALIVFYVLGTSLLQRGYQFGDALTAAGLATLTTNAVPIVAGFIVFGEELPGGTKGVLQVAAFSSVVASAALLARRPAPSV